MEKLQKLGLPALVGGLILFIFVAKTFVNIGYGEAGVLFKTFGNGVVHGYSHDAGHGILDIYAALQPITSTSYAQVVYAGAENKLGQSFTLNSSRLSGSQSFGDAIKNALKDEYGSDGEHPNKKGYEVMSLLAERKINKVLDQ